MYAINAPDPVTRIILQRDGIITTTIGLHTMIISLDIALVIERDIIMTATESD
jgi:hypothetical protein